MKHFLILFAALCLCLGLHAAPAAADNDEDSDCPGNSCNAPPTGDVSSISDAEARARALALAGALAIGGDQIVRVGGDRTIVKNKATSSSEGNKTQVNVGGDRTSIRDGDVTLVVEGDQFDAPDVSKTPGTPASVGIDVCGSGFSLSAPGVGASGSKPSRFCHLLTLSTVYQHLGERATNLVTASLYLEIASDLREEARYNVKRRGRFTRALHLDELPIIGWLLFRD